MATDIAKLREMSPEDLAKEEKEVREEIWKLRLQMTTGQLQDPYKVRRTRRQLARVLTVSREKQLETASGEGR
jgi:large subunit ribosomal protein L29